MNTLRYPPNVQWEVTSECNHNCIHCYNYWRKDFHQIEGMSRVNTEEQYLLLASKIVEQKPVSVVITGGEPLLVFDKIKSSIDLFLKHGIVVSINTNAALLNEDLISFLKKRGIGLFVSFPCANENICDFITSTNNSFKKVVEKLDLAHKMELPFTTNIVVSTLNLNYVEDTATFLKRRYKLPNVYITRVGKPINSDASFDKYMLSHDEIGKLQDISVALSKKLNIKLETSCPYTACSIRSKEAFELFAYTKICTAGRTSYAVDTEGNVKACPRDSTLYGNILQEDFGLIWNRLDAWRNGSYIPDECKKCDVFERCMGGCRVDSLPFTGKLNKLDTISNINNLPIKFNKNIAIDNTIYSCEDTFSTAKNIKFTLEEEGFYRVAVNRTYMYITDMFFNFLSKNQVFSLKDLAKSFNVDMSTANDVVKTLIFNGIIYFSKKGE